MTELSNLDKHLLEEIQQDIPLVNQPYRLMGERIGISEDQVLSTIKNLIANGYIRDISAIYNAAGLGYKSTLVALSTLEPDRTAAEISLYPGVSHNYFREHDFNIWFTLTIPEDLSFEKVIDDILINAEYRNYRILPSIKTFKIGVNFRFSSDKKKKDKNTYSSAIKKMTIDQDLIRSLQKPFPLVPSPWSQIAHELGKTEDDMFREILLLKEAKVIKRISGVLRHRKAGFGANGMACFQLNEDQIDEAGKKAAEFNAVSHCYQRPVYPDWPYSLFAMTHGTSKDECEEVIKEIAGEIGAEKSLTLYSTKEYKKERVKYFL